MALQFVDCIHVYIDIVQYCTLCYTQNFDRFSWKFNYNFR